MKKLACTLLVAMVTMVAMKAIAIEPPVINPPPVVTLTPKFVIKNLTSNDAMTVELKDFSPGGTFDVYFSKGVYEGDELEISYEPLPLVSPLTYQVTWTHGWGMPDGEEDGTGFTKKFYVKKASYAFPLQNNKFAVACTSSIEGQSELIWGQVEETKIYTLYFPNVQRGNQITVKNSDASEVQVTYADYEKVSSGQRATIALYDIYGNPVSTGYLDNLGMGTLSTKGKSGIYIVKVIMNNQVIFNQRIQVK